MIEALLFACGLVQVLALVIVADIRARVVRLENRVFNLGGVE